MKVINSPEDKRELEFPGDDPSWLVSYHENKFTPVIHGMCYHFSVSMQNQVLEEEKAKREVPLYQRDLDYSRGNILAHRLTEVRRMGDGPIAFAVLICVLFVSRWMVNN